MLVYKYRSGTTRDIEALMNNQFYSASIESLNDVHEGKIIIDNQEIELSDLLIKNPIFTFISSMNDIFEKYIQECKSYGIYSLSKNYDNELLWAYYANSYKGFCIEYDLEILKQYPLKQEAFYDVMYSKNIPTLRIGDISEPKTLLKKLLSTKSLNWKHEDEFRIITGTVGIYHYFNRAVKSIYFGHRTPENTIKLVMNILRGKGIEYYKISHQKNTYKLIRKKIEDIFKDESIYKNKVNKFIPYLNEKTKPYEDLIKKAIIIVEQEPLCEEVIDADISSKGTKDNPVFYVMYENKIKNLPTPNYFISKKQIEEIFKN